VWLWLRLWSGVSLRAAGLRLRMRMRVEGSILHSQPESAEPERPDRAEQDPGNTDVLRVLLENHARFLDFVERRVGSRDVAEDILQEAFVRSLDRAASLRRAESITAWFYRVLRNAITDHFRRQDTRRRAFERMAAESDEPVPSMDEELNAVVCACVLALLDTLKPDYAEALRRVDLEDMTVRAYGEKVGISPSNAGVRLHRAREALRRQMARSCGTCLTHGCLDCRCGTPAGPSSLGNQA
jgi:RNA polymerase sigma factor (sigma-70 family)